jgi:hypothetical protein
MGSEPGRGQWAPLAVEAVDDATMRFLVDCRSQNNRSLPVTARQSWPENEP